MAEAGLQEVETYVSHRQNTMEKYVATRHIMYLCLMVKRRPGPRVALRWWEHEGMDLEWMRMAAQEAERTDGGEETDGIETETYN